MGKARNKGIQVHLFEKQYGQESLDLILGIQRNEFHIPITAEDQPDLIDIQGFYQKQNGNFWVAACESKVVGTIGLIDIGNHSAALRKMFVHAGFRGTGTADMLLKTLLSWSETHGLRRIYLGTTSRFLAAHRFYEKSGFKEIPKRDLPHGFPVMEVDSKFYRMNLS